MSAPLVRVSSGRQRWLVRVEDLQEVVPMMALGHVEGLGGQCRGLIDLRGELVPVFDKTDGALSPERLILVLREPGGPVGLVVDEVHEVLCLAAGQLVSRPVGAGRTRSLARVGEELFTLLEPGEVTAHGG
jgi:purine-binding chemotaxis protein CheW